MVKEVDEYRWKKVPVDDPRKCQIPSCRNISIEGTNNCPCHGGQKAASSNEKKRLKNYRLAVFHDRISELANNNEIISLTDEIGILRILIEEKINRCSDASDLLLISGPLSDLIMKSEKLIAAAEKLEMRLGKYLSKDKIIQFAQEMIEIISRYIENPTVLDAIGEDFSNLLKEI